MNKSRLHIDKMDCSAEASLVEMKLRELPGIGKVEFTISSRSVTVQHIGPAREVFDAVDSLGFGATLISTEQVQEELSVEDKAGNSKVLWIVLIINFVFFVAESVFGFLSHSVGLLADSLDMLADAFVYGLSLYAVGRAVSQKKQVAGLAAYLQFALAGLGLFEVIHRFFGPRELPTFSIMVSMSACALLANAYTLWLLNRAQTGEAHIKASVICTSNDVIANAGVIVAGLVVLFTKSPLPDLIVGSVVFVLVGRGAFAMLALSK